MQKIHFLIIPLFALAFLLVSCKRSTPLPATPPPPAVNQGKTFHFDGTLLSGKHVVSLKTTKGTVALELDADAAPRTVTNFITLAKAGYYDGLTFHRVVDGFMVQGGDPDGTGRGGTSIFGETFEDEINAATYGLDTKTLKDAAEEQSLPPELENLTVKQFYEQKEGYRYNDSLPSLPMARGTIAMANRGANTNGSQFFIVQAQSVPWLEGKHTVFGKVTEGMDVVDAIAKVERDGSDRPVEPVTYTVEVLQ